MKLFRRRWKKRKAELFQSISKEVGVLLLLIFEMRWPPKLRMDLGYRIHTLMLIAWRCAFVRTANAYPASLSHGGRECLPHPPPTLVKTGSSYISNRHLFMFICIFIFPLSTAAVPLCCASFKPSRRAVFIAGQNDA